VTNCQHESLTKKFVAPNPADSTLLNLLLIKLSNKWIFCWNKSQFLLLINHNIIPKIKLLIIVNYPQISKTPFPVIISIRIFGSLDTSTTHHFTCTKNTITSFHYIKPIHITLPHITVVISQYSGIVQVSLDFQLFNVLLIYIYLTSMSYIGTLCYVSVTPMHGRW
jgi:hypothetical protein